MPIDPSIPLQVRAPQLMSPEQAVSLQALSRQNQLGQLKIEDALRARQEQAGLREALQAPGAIDPKTGTVSLEGLQEVYRRSPDAGARMAKERLASLKSVADIGKIDAETMRARVEGAAKKAELGAQVYQAASIAYDQAREAGIPEAQAVAAGRTALLAKMDSFERGGLLADAGLTPEAVEKIKSNPPDPLKWRSQAQTYTQYLTDLRAAQGRVETNRHNLRTEGIQGATLAETRRANQERERTEAEERKKGKWTNDLERGIQINTDTGETRPIRSAGVPIGEKGREKKDEEVDKTLRTYVAARDGLMTGLENSVTGPIAGRYVELTSAQQIASGAVSAMAPVLKQLFRVAGEGVFTDRDQQLLIDMVPARTDRPAAAKAKMENIDRIVSEKLGRKVQSFVPPSAISAKPKFLGFEK